MVDDDLKGMKTCKIIILKNARLYLRSICVMEQNNTQNGGFMEKISF